MNCQEFRQLWMHDDDITDTTHIETCDDCLNWIEANFTSEEALFMKEFPQPSAQLEDRIMQAIYQLSGPQAVPPLTAAMENVTHAASPKRFPRRYLQLGWVGAAAAILAVGLVGVQVMNKNQADQVAFEAPASSGAKSGAANQEATAPSVATAPESQPNTTTPAAESSSTGSTTAPDANQGAGNQQPNAQNQGVGNAATAAKPPQPKAAGASIKEPQPMEKVAMSEAPSVSAPATNSNTMLAARNNQQTALADNQPAAAGQPAIQGPVAIFGGGQSDLADNSSAASTESTAGIAGAADQPAAAASLADAPAASQPQTAKAQITLSTFTDVETASHSSDMPIPSVTKLPSGFALSSVSLRYESETSQRVTNLSVMYHRNADPVKIEVTRLPAGEHNLSVPGTFTETQVFQIAGERAIGVTYDPQTHGGNAGIAQRAVHFYTKKGNDTLYVILSASGISLSELTQLAKEMTWTGK